MSVDDETQKLIRLRRVTQEAQARRETLQNVWEKMQIFAQGLRNELDGMYWSENLIAFEDLETVPQFNQFRFNYSELERLNQFRFNYSELERLFDIATIRETLLSYRKLSEEKERLEVDLGISMDRVSGRN
jgi:hypothetical protein